MTTRSGARRNTLDLRSHGIFRCIHEYTSEVYTNVPSVGSAGAVIHDVLRQKHDTALVVAADLGTLGNVDVRSLD